jgi:putative tryptophan/tyrosine transport system substrate-binding protein
MSSRRQFITLLGGAAVAWPLAARAQQPAKVPTIGYLGSSTASAQSQWVAAFVQRLHDLGWIEGRTIAIQYRWAEGRTERFHEIAAEFARLKVDVIVTAGTAPVLAAKQSATNVPIVFAVASDPIGNNLVASLAHPGGNVTGLSIQQTDLAAKKLELLREAVPDFRRLASLANVGSPASVLEKGEVQAAARMLNLDVVPVDVRRAEDIVPAFAALKGRAEALYVCGDALITNNRIRIITLALGSRLATMYPSREHVDAGGLMSYGPNFPDLHRRGRLCHQDSARYEASRHPSRAADQVRFRHQPHNRQGARPRDSADVARPRRRGDRMKRRDFITLLGGAAATWPLAARAQQPAMPVVGFLSTLSPSNMAANVMNEFARV